jgi:hypothetical protein
MILWSSIYLFAVITCHANALRVRGRWHPNEEQMKIIAKFAIQPLDALFPQFTRGFIFGNVTNVNKNQPTSNVAMFVVPETRIRSFEHGDFWQLECNSLLEDISSVVYEPRCLKNGQRWDFMRWISCPINGYCIDETQTDKVVSGSQFTFRIDEPVIPEFWYIVFVTCRLNENCSWVETVRDDPIEYDIRLTNGHPELNVDVLIKEFSFEEQNIFEIMLFSLGCFIALALVQWRASFKNRLRCSPLRSKLLSTAIGLQIGGLFIQIVNMLRFIKTGLSVPTLCFLSEVRNFGSICNFNFFSFYKIHLTA